MFLWSHSSPPKSGQWSAPISPSATLSKKYRPQNSIVLPSHTQEGGGHLCCSSAQQPAGKLGPQGPREFQMLTTPNPHLEASSAFLASAQITGSCWDWPPVQNPSSTEPSDQQCPQVKRSRCSGFKYLLCCLLAV